jgi:hypothetical protein
MFVPGDPLAASADPNFAYMSYDWFEFARMRGAGTCSGEY